MSEVLRGDVLDGDKIHSYTQQDVSEIYRVNRLMRNATPETGRYKGNLVHAAKIPSVVIEKMRNGQCCSNGIKYDLMSSDHEERKRALLHVQSEHKQNMTIEGTPFGKKAISWR